MTIRNTHCRSRVWCACAAALTVLLCGCMQGVRTADNDGLYQYATIGALLVGVYDGDETFGNLLRYGDFGIGTFNDIDGEMICLEGACYQVRDDGVSYPVSADQKTPFAMITRFDTDVSMPVSGVPDYRSLQEAVDVTLDTDNIAYGIKVSGTYSYIKTRSVSPQQKPYPPLSDVVEQQTVFEFHDVRGTMVGFRMPPYMGGVNVSGWHLHFLTEDRRAGGHLLECTVDNATVSIDEIHGITLVLPETEGFYAADLVETDSGNTE